MPPDAVFEMTQRGAIEDVVAASVNMTVGVARERASIIVVTGESNQGYIEKLSDRCPDFSTAMGLAEKKSGGIESIGIITHGGDFAPKF